MENIQSYYVTIFCDILRLSAIPILTIPTTEDTDECNTATINSELPLTNNSPSWSQKVAHNRLTIMLINQTNHRFPKIFDSEYSNTKLQHTYQLDE